MIRPRIPRSIHFPIRGRAANTSRRNTAIAAMAGLGATGVLLSACDGEASAGAGAGAPTTDGKPTTTAAGGRTTAPTDGSGSGSRAKAPSVDCTKVKCIALTFDDGPGPYTSRLLDTLKSENVPATFFLVGQRVAENPGIVRREADEGHEIGNHTWDHKDLAKLTPDEVKQEIDRTGDAIVAAGAPRPTLLRPPYGSVNAAVSQTAGMPFIMWRVDPEDWKYKDAATVAKNIVDKAKVGRIVLSHDIYQSTVDAMPSAIQQLKAQGYTFVTVSELMAGADMQNGKSYFNRPVSLDPPGSANGTSPDPTSTTSPLTPGDAPTTPSP